MLLRYAIASLRQQAVILRSEPYAAGFGVIYFFIGLFLLRRNLIALWFGAILPRIGGLLGIYRFVFLYSNPFTVFHVLIDLIVVQVYIHYLRQKRDRKLGR